MSKSLSLALMIASAPWYLSALAAGGDIISTIIGNILFGLAMIVWLLTGN